VTLRSMFRTVRRTFISDPAWIKLRSVRNLRLVSGPLTYNQDGLATRHNADFIHDPRFRDAYRKGEQTGSWRGAAIHWRAYVACWAADKASRLEGDFVECGVNKGGLARTIIEFTRFKDLPKRFYLLDTYQGLVEECLTHEERALGRTAGGYEECFESVKRTFSEFPNIVLVRGTVPNTLSQVSAEKVAYLSIDMNCAMPEIAAAEYFWDRMVTGGVILLDDYGWQGAIAQKRAFDEFARKRHTLVLPLPTGQGVILKP